MSTGKSLEIVREQWQRQIMAAPGRQLAHLAVAMAISWHLNRNTGDAWPGFATLAKETGLGHRTVKRAVKWLEAGGHLRVVHSRGGNISNRYRPILSSGLCDTASSGPCDTAVEAGSGPYDTTAVVHESHSSGPHGTRTSKEPLSNLERDAPTSKSGKAKKGKRGLPRKQPSIGCPPSWLPSSTNYEHGARLGFSRAEIDRSAVKFRGWHVAKGSLFANWAQAFNNWLDKEAEFQNRQPHSAVNGAVLSFRASPGSPQWQAHRTHLRDINTPHSRSLIRELDKRELEGRPFPFESEWPPGFPQPKEEGR
jgi:hypothetical protein